MKLYLLAVASVIVAFCYIVMFLFTGVPVAIDSIPNWLSWIQWISAFRYSFGVLAVNDFRNITFCVANFPDICPMIGSEVLEKLALDYATSWDMWKYFFGLTMMTLTFFLLAYIQLFRIKKTK
jgi:ATP-binding cassette subfamily G (WHITE) protein 2